MGLAMEVQTKGSFMQSLPSSTEFKFNHAPPRQTPFELKVILLSHYIDKFEWWTWLSGVLSQASYIPKRTIEFGAVEMEFLEDFQYEG